MTGVKIIPIIPKVNPFPSEREMNDTINGTLDQGVDFAESLFTKATATWSDKNKPKLLVKTFSYGRRVTASGTVFGYVDKGTRPHMIYPRRAKRLRFNGSGFKAKSRVRYLYAYAGSVGGGQVFRPRVSHPGFPAREFSIRVSEEMQKELPRMMRANIKRMMAHGGK
jgi:hypothetical protein